MYELIKQDCINNTFEVGSLTERVYLNLKESDYQNEKSSLREKIAELFTNVYKGIFQPKPYERIKLGESIQSSNPVTVLEVGAGNDDLYNNILPGSKIKRYIRSDLSENQLNQIKDSRIENLVYDGIKHPLEDYSVDVVFSKCVLHHIDNGCKEGREKNRISFLKEQKRLVNNNGRVYCMDVYAPYKNGIRGALWHFIKHRLILGEEEHNFLTTKETVELFKKADFKNIQSEEVDTYKGKYFLVSGGT